LGGFVVNGLLADGAVKTNLCFSSHGQQMRSLGFPYSTGTTYSVVVPA
jgi:hypothetical protein